MMKRTPILTTDLMRQCDSHTINTLGVPSQVLMERAARRVAEHLETHPERFPADGSILVLCGGGNNGGDGFAVARFLQEGIYGKSRSVAICYGGALNPDGSPDKKKMSAECARQYEYACTALIPLFSPAQVGHMLSHAAVVVDALFGIGLDRPIEGETAALIRAVNDRGVPVLAVDIPSGVHGDTGEIMGVAIKATDTVTMQALKAGLLRYPGADYCGHIVVADIGVDLSLGEDCGLYLAERSLLAAVLPSRARRSHKGTYGRLALICGSAGMAGAAMLSAKGALRAGAGLLQVITPACNREIIQISVPEAIVTCYETEAPRFKDLVSELSACNGLVVGCGLSISAKTAELLGAILENCPIRPDYPVMLDADALNLIAKHPHLWQTRLLTQGRGQVILTPHPMEMARLTGLSVGDILADPVAHARALAAERGVTVVLKDAHTVIAAASGYAYLCPYGNAGMATGGSGDVLAGILGSLGVQRRAELGGDLSLWDIAAAGVALHGLAGDHAAEVMGEYAMTPSDIIEALGAVTRDLSDTRSHLSYGQASAETSSTACAF